MKDELLSPCCRAPILILDCPRPRHGGAIDFNGERPRCAVCGRYLAYVCENCQQPIANGKEVKPAS